eukprot:TRINITY_DN907_c0_g1_i1.p1 TRINITY_DN907_c0_g1~~TRINITY_DN907_c0_g1_i1.p1  ORF type:complete len:557 (+),score=102.17 TRINITY_DN907_c0_g1_i1:81-1673(+)
MSASESWANVQADGPLPAGGEHVGVWPMDEHNVKLLDAVHPRGWKNPNPGEDVTYDLVAIGAGAAGLTCAKQSARRGARSALVEMHLAGGDCLNVGCVPSKALLRCARAAVERRRAACMGGAQSTGDDAVDFGVVMERMRRIRAEIAPVDSHETTQGTGADMYTGKAVFIGRHELRVGDRTLRFKKAVITTGGRAKIFPIPGLADAPYMTNATLFNLTSLPPRFVVIGAGPIGLEMAQAFRRFGSQVTVLEAFERILGPEDESAAKILHSVLENEGVRLMPGVKVESVEHTKGEPWPEVRITVRKGDADPEIVVCDALLVATGRVPNVEGLGLEEAGVEYAPGLGIKVNDDLSTTNPDIFAAGDVIDRPEFRFTHTAGSMGGMVVQNALFAGRGLPVNAPSCKLSEVVVPRCTYTEPEVASCGIANSHMAKRANVEVDVYTSQLLHNDRAICDGEREGFAMAVCRKDTDELLGATVVAERAGDMLGELTLAVQHKLGLSAIARTIHPYPTLGEVVQQCALNFNRARWEKL